MLNLMDDLDKPFPPITPALLRAIDARFPLRRPQLGDTAESIWFDAGSRRVVEFLQEQHHIQSENLE